MSRSPRHAGLLRRAAAGLALLLGAALAACADPAAPLAPASLAPATEVVYSGVGAGAWHTCAVRTCGVVQLAVGRVYHNCAARSGSEVVCWGNNGHGEATVVGATGFVDRVLLEQISNSARVKPTLTRDVSCDEIRPLRLPRIARRGMGSRRPGPNKPRRATLRGELPVVHRGPEEAGGGGRAPAAPDSIQEDSPEGLSSGDPRKHTAGASAPRTDATTARTYGSSTGAPSHR
jgi:hypothetical protein